MPFRLIAMDLDGTLLSKQQTVSPRNLAVLRQLAKQGVHICIATGRKLETAKTFMACLDFPHTLAVCNGALIVEQPTGTELFRSYLNGKQVREILTSFDRHQFNTRRDIVTDGCWYVTPCSENTKDSIGRYGIKTAEIPQVWTDEPAAKVMAHIPRELSRSLLDSARTDLPDYNVVLSAAFLMEIVAGNVGKDKAICALARHLGIPLSEVVAFGDQINDLDMLKTAGLGVAMGNATDEVKQAADQVTLRYDEDGVAVMLESLFALDGLVREAV